MFPKSGDKSRSGTPLRIEKQRASSDKWRKRRGNTIWG